MAHLAYPECCASPGMKTSAFHGVILIVQGTREEEGTWEGLAAVMTFQLRERLPVSLPTMASLVSASPIASIARTGCPVMAVHRTLPD